MTIAYTNIYFGVNIKCNTEFRVNSPWYVTCTDKSTQSDKLLYRQIIFYFHAVLPFGTPAPEINRAI